MDRVDPPAGGALALSTFEVTSALGADADVVSGIGSLLLSCVRIGGVVAEAAAATGGMVGNRGACGASRGEAGSDEKCVCVRVPSSDKSSSSGCFGSCSRVSRSAPALKVAVLGRRGRPAGIVLVASSARVRTAGEEAVG